MLGSQEGEELKVEQWPGSRREGGVQCAVVAQHSAGVECPRTLGAEWLRQRPGREVGSQQSVERARREIG